MVPQREVFEHQGAVGPDHAEEADEGADEAARAATRGKIAAALDPRIPVLVLFWGDPTPFVDPAHAAGTKLVVQAGSAEEAATAARAGVDAIIAQGVEAGGHVRAVDSIWVVLPRAVEVARGVPVLAAGGITDGTSIARALRMGAQGVSLGTRFVAHYRSVGVRALHGEARRGDGIGHGVRADLYGRLARRAAPRAAQPDGPRVGGCGQSTGG